MANFELKIDEQGFEALGIKAGFDESLYGELLDVLPGADELLGQTPLVSIRPAMSWGQHEIIKAMRAHNGQYSSLPGVIYDGPENRLALKASESAVKTNEYLLYGTRRMMAHMSGEMGSAEERNFEHRYLRRSVLLGSTGVGVVTGFSAAGAEGAFIGGVVGSMAGMVGSILDYRSNPYFRDWASFPQDPEVQAEYGRIISYSQAS